jgi:Protein of unknown function (DUF3467)
MQDELRSPEANMPNPIVPPPQQQFTTDTSAISTVYTNFCRVSVTPEELVLDFGLNTQVVPTPTETVKLSHRIVMNFFTAKRLLGALANVVQAHEQSFGALELDFQRRMRGGRQVMPTLTQKP